MTSSCYRDRAETIHEQPAVANQPMIVSTWQHGLAANARAMEVLSAGGTAIDAVEAGVMVTEADPTNQTVGLGGRPDRDGIVSLDASIMNAAGNCGSVAAIQDILHPIKVARWVMERTPHVMLVGDGARQFALEQGMQTTDLMTEQSRKDWQQWLEEESNYQPPINIENHDTIGMLALDAQGNLSGACTTSGAGFKYHGRVGDSPIIGAGLYIDNEVGGATATGWGEAVIRACGSFLVVEFMRQGYSPTKACKMAVERVVDKSPDWRDIQVGFIALDKFGRHGGYCIQPGFDYAVLGANTPNQMIVPPHFAQGD
ncbi:MAG: N(4)-(beta-N-acetylglucosaminyl)-L-asparaginase [Bacteroidota bacterium]